MASCPDVLANASYAQCGSYCDCANAPFRFSAVSPTDIGPIFGFQVSFLGLLAYIIAGLTVIVLLFLLLFPVINGLVDAFWKSLASSCCRCVKNPSPRVLRLRDLLQSLTRFLSHVRFPPGGWLILIGVAIGGVILSTGRHNVVTDVVGSLNIETILVILIPPLQLSFGFNVDKRLLLKNLPGLLFHAVFGTIATTFLLALSFWGTTSIYTFLECLLLASVLSPFDPGALARPILTNNVKRTILSLLVDESVLNVAFSVVLFAIIHALGAGTDTISNNNVGIIVSLGIAKFVITVLFSVLIGIAFGFLASFISRFTHHHPLLAYLQPVIVLVFAYLTYFVCSSVLASGILGMLFAATIMSYFIKENMTESSRVVMQGLLQGGGAVFRGFLLIFVGVSICDSILSFDWTLIIVSILGLFFFRVLMVLLFDGIRALLLFYFGKFPEDRILKYVISELVLRSFSGGRGAICMVLGALMSPKLWPNQPTFLTTALVVLVFSTYIHGAFVSALVYVLPLKKQPVLSEEACQTYKTLLGMVQRLLRVLLPNRASITNVLKNQSALLPSQLTLQKTLTTDINTTFIRLRTFAMGLHSKITAQFKLDFEEEDHDLELQQRRFHGDDGSGGIASTPPPQEHQEKTSDNAVSEEEEEEEGEIEYVYVDENGQVIDMSSEEGQSDWIVVVEEEEEEIVQLPNYNAMMEGGDDELSPDENPTGALTVMATLNRMPTDLRASLRRTRRFLKTRALRLVGEFSEWLQSVSLNENQELISHEWFIAEDVDAIATVSETIRPKLEHHFRVFSGHMSDIYRLLIHTRFWRASLEEGYKSTRCLRTALGKVDRMMQTLLNRKKTIREETFTKWYFEMRAAAADARSSMNG